MFQIALPTAVSTTKGSSGISAKPAGREIRLRTPGTMRPIRTDERSWRSNHARARSRSSSSMSGIRRRSAATRSVPSLRAIQYRASAPSVDPTVAAIAAAGNARRSWLARYPAIGSTTSLGIGGKNTSPNVSRPTPSVPSAAITSAIQPTSPVSCWDWPLAASTPTALSSW